MKYFILSELKIFETCFSSKLQRDSIIVVSVFLLVLFLLQSRTHGFRVPHPLFTHSLFQHIEINSKLYPYVGHTHHFNLFSELFVKCLQSHINLNEHLKYLLRKCAEQRCYLTFTHSAVAGCDTASLAYSPCSVTWQSYHLSELWHLGLSLLCPKIHTVCRNLQHTF